MSGPATSDTSPTATARSFYSRGLSMLRGYPELRLINLSSHTQHVRLSCQWPHKSHDAIISQRRFDYITGASGAQTDQPLQSSAMAPHARLASTTSTFNQRERSMVFSRHPPHLISIHTQKLESTNLMAYIHLLPLRGQFLQCSRWMAGSSIPPRSTIQEPAFKSESR